MMGNLERTKKAYFFFQQHIHQEFTIEDLIGYTGWKKVTVKTYFNKKWKHFLEKTSENNFKVKTFSYPTFEEFKQLQTQNFGTSVSKSQKYDYNITVSFAGEDRKKVEELVSYLKEFRLSIFYDKNEQAQLWGADLYEHLDDVYKNKSQYCIIFISQHYSKKRWTTHERKSAQERAFRDSSNYILPVRLDDTVIPGIRETTGYLDARKLSMIEIGNILLEKLGIISDINDLLAYLRSYLSKSDKIIVEGAYIRFILEDEDYNESFPISMLLAMHEHGLLFGRMGINFLPM